MTANVSSKRVADGEDRERGETERKRGGGRRGRKGIESNIQKETGGAKVMETPLPFPQEGKQFDLSHTKKQHIAKKDISHFPVEGNSHQVGGGYILYVCVCLFTNTFTA